MVFYQCDLGVPSCQSQRAVLRRVCTIIGGHAVEGIRSETRQPLGAKILLGTQLEGRDPALPFLYLPGFHSKGI